MRQRVSERARLSTSTRPSPSSGRLPRALLICSGSAEATLYLHRSAYAVMLGHLKSSRHRPTWIQDTKGQHKDCIVHT